MPVSDWAGVNAFDDIAAFPLNADWLQLATVSSTIECKPESRSGLEARFSVTPIYIYLLKKSKPNSNHLYEHGFMVIIPIVGQSKIDYRQTSDTSLIIWRQPFCNFDYKMVASMKKGTFHLFVDKVNFWLPDDWYYIHVTMVVQIAWVWTFSTIIAIIRACACWALFVVTLTNTVRLIYIYTYTYIYIYISDIFHASNWSTYCGLSIYRDWIWCAVTERATAIKLKLWSDFEHMKTPHISP